MSNLMWRVVKAIFRDEFRSQTLRNLFYKIHGVQVGKYSYGCFDPLRIPRGTVVGRYCSFARTSAIFNGNHGLGFLSLHPFLYNTRLGIVAEERIVRNNCIVEDDVWMGHNSIICPSVRFVGRGSVIGAGAVVTKDVPRYAVVSGVPARLMKFRFTKGTIHKIERSEWWLQDEEHLRFLVDKKPNFVYTPECDEL